MARSIPSNIQLLFDFNWDVVASIVIGVGVWLMFVGPPTVRVYRRERRELAFRAHFWMVRGRDRGEQQAAGVSARLEQLGTVLNDLIMKLWSGRPEEEAVRIAGEQLRNAWQAAKDTGFYVGKSPWDFIPKTY